MDYAFAPGADTDFDIPMQKVQRLRRKEGELHPTTNLLGTSGRLEDFFNDLRSGQPPRVTRPIGELVLVSHASANGWLAMPLTAKVYDDIQYEAFDNVGTDIRIPTEILDKKVDGSPRPTTVHISGCRIGMAEPFLLRLKQALQYADKVIAPKHFHSGGTWELDGGNVACIEYLAYCFESYSLTRLKERKQVIQLFTNDKHKFFDDTDVSSNYWNDWVPKIIPKSAGDPQRRRFEVVLPDRWGVPPPWNEGPIEKTLIFKYEIDMLGPWQFPPAEPNADKQAVQDHIHAQLETMPICKSTTWQLWKRRLKKRYESFGSLADLVAGYNWKFDKTLKVWEATRHLYRCVVPITWPIGSKTLLANFYPQDGQAAHVDLDENDTRLYGSV